MTRRSSGFSGLAALPGVRAFLVGGAVRDALMQVPVGDRDWVVVGARAQNLLDLGFRPVGRDFPVFLDPQTQDEVALARTERKTAAGYHGFAFHADPSVTLEEDLARRDLTINAMAQAPDGLVIDPFGGQRDLAARTLRHVGDAFAEDPVRILRLARFAARWPDFGVAPETLALCRRMVADGEVAALVAERVWQELSRGLMEVRPSRMLQVLRDCGALQVLLPEVDRLYGVPQPPVHHPEVDTGVHLELVLDMAAQLHAALPVRFACLVHDLGKGTTPASLWPRHLGHEGRSVALLQSLATRWRVPADCRELGALVAQEHGHVHASAALGAAALVRLLGRCDAWRRPERFEQILLACECDARGRQGFAASDYPQRPHLRQVLFWAQQVDAGAVARQCQAAARSAGAPVQTSAHGEEVAADGLPGDGSSARDSAPIGAAIARAVEAARTAAVQAGLTALAGGPNAPPDAA